MKDFDNFPMSLASTFMIADERVCNFWKSYTSDWIKANSQDDEIAMGIASAMLDEAWKGALAARDAEARLRFEEAVSRWEKVHMDAILKCEGGRA